MVKSNSDFTLTATGDALITKPIDPFVGKPRFDSVVEILQDSDASIGHLEVTLPDEGTYATPPRAVPDRHQYLSARPGIVLGADSAVLDDLSRMGINMITGAGNHAFDYGHAGVEDTVAALRESNHVYAGIGTDLWEARSPSYRDTGNGRVALVNTTTSMAPGSEADEQSPLSPGRPGINPLHVRWIYKLTNEQISTLQEISESVGIEDIKETWLSRDYPSWEDEDYFFFMNLACKAVEDVAHTGIDYHLYEPDHQAVLEQVNIARDNANWVVMGLHTHQGPSGTRNVSGVPDFVRAFAHECIDEGADVVVGTGPRVLRPIEIYNGKPIFYSLGAFFYQTQPISRLPPECFRYYGVEDFASPHELWKTRYYDDDGTPIGYMGRSECWETIIPKCKFINGELKTIELYPVVLKHERHPDQQDSPAYADDCHGLPMIADGERGKAILERLASKSEEFGTVITFKNNIGMINL
ncbi:hypothetical protein C2R22_24165 (plasmid) [Salinigranum rubrum]|uniref:Capsule synthesis protein CapA domain-containing protein n=1 Tax=Salinigranum rubrum TaxID=755307 RepID=A0A2I8VRS7_9EURY|nr:CapA family protein [Salinigranum rubrum]AUV84628.1 hypothetical protein C2R22_24165 [Salinigranum rubrum]